MKRRYYLLPYVENDMGFERPYAIDPSTSCSDSRIYLAGSGWRLGREVELGRMYFSSKEEAMKASDARLLSENEFAPYEYILLSEKEALLV